MTWFKVDDSFGDHPKVFDAPDAAVALWVRAGVWSARMLTDGFVPAGLPRRLCDSPNLAVEELLQRGLWEVDADGWRFHDWLDYQPSRDEVLDKRSAESTGGSLGNHKRWHVAKGVTAPMCPHCTPSNRVGDRGTDRVGDQVPEGVPDSPPNPPVPSRPDPTTKEQSQELALPRDKTTTNRRGTRLPDDWQPSAALLQWCAAEIPRLNVRSEVDGFRDYWAAESSAKAVKRDWDAAFRNWMRNAVKFAGNNRSNGNGLPKGYVERDGRRFKVETVSNLDQLERYAQMDAERERHALGAGDRFEIEGLAS